ncbi:MAG TPA: hotdog fold thioesterase [Desulfobacterales bacterium]|nr:hotdog fold thioesterase [Desulfobacterales bacterium]
MENIWKQKFTIKDFNDFSKNSIVGYLGIVFTEKGNDFLKGTMPVDKKTIQPHGILHGGASVVLAETLGSAASSMAVDDQHYTVGMEVNANHIKSVTKGIVTGTAKPVHIGNTTQVWDIIIKNDKGRLTCISRLTMAVLKVK